MSSNNDVLALLESLIRLPSITPNDAGCQNVIANRLQPLGFNIEKLRFGEVDNLWARKGSDLPLLVFAGHTDVVPTGPIENWFFPPFQPTIQEGLLYGRGTADMKASLAAMVIACEQFLKKYPQHHGSIAFLITSDEEGPSIDGTRRVIEYLKNRKESLTWCIVGEPSCEQRLGDTIKIGRRGSLNGKLIIKGKQGHIAYPHLADNPIHRSLAALAALIQEVWDNEIPPTPLFQREDYPGNPNFPATSLQFSNIHAGVGATNVIPAQLEANFNFRYSPSVKIEELQHRFETILQRQSLDYNIEWTHSGSPFLTQNSSLVHAAQKAIETTLDLTPVLSTSGGTSDARFIAPTGCEVIEFGPCNGSIHQINENVAVKDLYPLTQIYEKILVQLLV